MLVFHIAAGNKEHAVFGLPQEGNVFPYGLIQDNPFRFQVIETDGLDPVRIRIQQYLTDIGLLVLNDRAYFDTRLQINLDKPRRIGPDRCRDIEVFVTFSESDHMAGLPEWKPQQLPPRRIFPVPHPDDATAVLPVGRHGGPDYEIVIIHPAADITGILRIKNQHAGHQVEPVQVEYLRVAPVERHIHLIGEMLVGDNILHPGTREGSQVPRRYRFKVRDIQMPVFVPEFILDIPDLSSVVCPLITPDPPGAVVGNHPVVVCADGFHPYIQDTPGRRRDIRQHPAVRRNPYTRF